jgi:hypothetical protein
MTAILGLLAFLDTPLGKALVKVVPTLVEDVIGIWHKDGTVTDADLVAYVASQKSFDVLVPKKTP